MGKRGPLTGHTFGAKTGPKPDPERAALLAIGTKKAKAAAKTTGRAVKAATAAPRSSGAPPATPDSLSVVGAAIWREIWSSAPFLNPQLDAFTVQRFCEVAQDARRARQEVEERGLLLEEPIVARGVTVGSRWVANPAEAMLRRCDRALDALAAQIGASPQARARLGLAVASAELAEVQASRIISTMFRSPVIDLEEAE